MIFDTHAHYDDRQYDSDREALLASLTVNGVGRVVNVAADTASVETTYALAKKYDFIYAALGIHPDGVEFLTEADMDRIAELSKDPKVVAVGEIGLDYYGRELPKEVQKKWFIRQLKLADDLSLPAIIHSRDAAQDTYEILRARGKKERAGIVHCFSYPKEMARQFLDLGYYIALGGVVTFKNGRVAKEVAAYVPEDRLLLETDCPYLSPVPHRGERNWSGNLSHVVSEIAALRGISEERLIKTTWDNANRLYGIE